MNDSTVGVGPVGRPRNGEPLLERLHEHRRVWAAKPVLEAVYAEWFDQLLSGTPTGGHVLEVGAGPGFFARHARRRRPDLRWTASDLLPAPWNDVAADAGQLPFDGNRFTMVVGLDVLHHLPQPAAFLAEAARVLELGGSLRLIEPWVTPFSFPIYRWLHHEDCELRIDPWCPFGSAETKSAWDGNAAIPLVLLRRTPRDRWMELGLSPPHVRRLNTFAYLMSLGFGERSLLPPGLVRPMLGLDRASAFLAPIFAMRALVRWERLGATDAPGPARMMP